MNRYFAMAILLLISSMNVCGQVYTSGHEDKKAEVNFTNLSNYYKEHPAPLRAKPMFDEDDEENEAQEPQDADPAKVHMIQRNGSRMVSGTTGAALLPISVAPADTFQATLSDGTAIPPDTHGETDGTYCLTATNTSLRIQLRNGTFVHNVQLGNFWATSLLASPDSAFDPRIHYDPHYKRWILVTDAYGETAHSTLLIAVSKTSDPRGAWWQYSVAMDPTGASWMDFPVVGFNSRWVVVTGNMFQNVSGTGATGAVAYVFNYNSLMSGAGAPFTKISEPSEFTLSPALTYDTAEQNIFLLDMNNPGAGRLQLWKISGPTASPTIASIGFPATTQRWHNGGSTDFVPQSGTTHKLQAGDDRITHVICRNHTLWCSHTVFLPDPGTASRCSIMWWQIDTLANPIQNGLIDDGATPSFFDYSSISVNANNDALIGFSYTNANMYPSAAYALHMHDDPSDSMRPLQVYRHGQKNYYQVFSGTQNRWGDYSNTCVDPVNNIDFWTIQESVPTTPANTWDTWWANVQMCSASASFTKASDSTSKSVRDVLTFSGMAPDGSTFAWNFGGGTGVPGTGEGPQSVTWTSNGWKIITLSVTDSGCTSVFTDSVLVKSSVGIGNVSLQKAGAEIVPNPNEGSFTVTLTNATSGPTIVTVADMQGRVVYNKEFGPGNNFQVTTNNLASGVYIVTIKADGTGITKEIKIER